MDQIDGLDLGGRVSVITGGTSGIGLEIVKTFVRHNSNVVFIGRKKVKRYLISLTILQAQDVFL